MRGVDSVVVHAGLTLHNTLASIWPGDVAPTWNSFQVEQSFYKRHYDVYLPDILRHFLCTWVPGVQLQASCLQTLLFAVLPYRPATSRAGVQHAYLGFSSISSLSHYRGFCHIKDSADVPHMLSSTVKLSGGVQTGHTAPFSQLGRGPGLSCVIDCGFLLLVRCVVSISLVLCVVVV